MTNLDEIRPFLRQPVETKKRKKAAVKKRRVVKREETKNFVVEDYRNPPKKDVKGYRSIKQPDGTLVTVAIMKKAGPRGGKTRVTSIKKPKQKA